MNQQISTDHKSSFWALTLGALGVVYGDIGTSPLYALRECFAPEHGIALSSANILGVLSLIFWTLISIICIKYMVYILRADNRGEGGILSLMALAVRTAHHESEVKRKMLITMLGVFGAALLYGDGIITPAISVLSAVEGVSFITPVFERFVEPITVIIMVGLFAVQRIGTGKIGFLFGPILLVWFFVLALFGVIEIMHTPQVLAALDPRYMIQFITENGFIAFVVLGSAVLVVTGGEALYADMGHFGRDPIRFGWFSVVFPALVLNYLGQGALLLQNPESIKNPFFLLAPQWAQPFMVVLATAATVIASQALISGVFSITRQAVQLGFCPRLSIVHTSSREIGQIYIPMINWALFAGVIWLVLTFKSSSALASAYGIAVTGTMVITTILAIEVALKKWYWSRTKTYAIFSIFLIVDMAFLGANLLKISHGGWVPLVIGGLIYYCMSTWKRGRGILYNELKKKSKSLDEFCEDLLEKPPIRIPGTAIYMSGDPWGVPVPLLHNIRHNKILHERVALLTIETREVPYVQKKDRVTVQEVIPNFYRIMAHYGFMETPKVKHILDACRDRDIHMQITDSTFVLGRETILPSKTPGMNIWHERVFAFMTKIAARPTAFFKIPPNQVIEVGIQVEI